MLTQAIQSTTRIIFMCLFISTTSNAQIYKWVDENGKTHFSDQKTNAHKTESVELKKHTSTWKKFDIEILDLSSQFNANELVKLEADINTIYWFYDNILYFDIHKTVPVYVTIFADKPSYVKHLKGLKLKGENSLGMYLPKTNSIVVYFNQNKNKTRRTIKHEVSHAIVDTLTPYVPAWLNEGLAEQMETISERDNKVVISAHKGNANYVLRLFREERLPQLENFFSLSSYSWRQRNLDDGFKFQSMGGELCYFLLESPQGKRFLIRLIHEFKRGNRTITSYLIDDLYTGGFQVLDNSWRRWLREKQKKPRIKYDMQ